MHRCKPRPVSPFRYFNSSPEVIRLVVLMYVRFPLSLRDVKDLFAERGIDLCHERCGCGGTGSARCSRATFADRGWVAWAASASGGGTWTRCT